MKQLARYVLWKIRYNSTITAVRQDADHVWGRRDSGLEMSPGWYASDVQLVGATLSWFEGCVTYGVQSGVLESRRPVEAMRPNPHMSIEGTIFEHGGSAVQNGAQYLEDCVFRNLQIAIAEGGALSAKLVHCTFRDNQHNWTLGAIQSRGIVMLDCRIGP